MSISFFLLFVFVAVFIPRFANKEIYLMC